MQAGGGSRAPDVAIIGGGIVGCAAAALLAEAGARVEVFERDEVAGAASGRNSGVVQHPFDPVLARLHADSVALYRDLDGLELPAEPAGMLMVAPDPTGLAPAMGEISAEAPELAPRLVAPDELAELEPALAAGLHALRLETGYPVRPAAATRAFARRAHGLGARFREGEVAWPWVGSGRARGVISAGVRRPTDAVLVAAGPWTPEVVDTTRGWRPIEPLWGVVVDVELAEPPRHVLEEGGIETVLAVARPEERDPAPVPAFSAVTANGVTAVGSTFLPDEPDPGAWTERLLRAGARFLPALANAEPRAVRACARPQSRDGRPLVGQGIHGLWVAAGHGPWGISTGPGTARLVADAILGRDQIPPELSLHRP